MDQSEELVARFLSFLDFKNITYEPDGNVSPDFTIEGGIAIEVRRLNQNYDDGLGQGPKGLETVAIPLNQRIKRYLETFGPKEEHSWFFNYSFSRPIPDWSVLRPELDKVLIPFISNSERSALDMKLPLQNKFRIQLVKASKKLQTFYRLGGNSDLQSGGWLIPEIWQNLQFSIDEKSKKIDSKKSNYMEWWLILADHIAYGLDDLEQEFFSDQVVIDPGSFTKIILVDPRNHKRYFIVWPKPI